MYYSRKSVYLCFFALMYLEFKNISHLQQLFISQCPTMDQALMDGGLVIP